MHSSWSPSSWRTKPVAQDVKYENKAELDEVTARIRKLPPLVSPSEIERLRHQLSLVQNNQAFLLHAGDCAESFEACTEGNIRHKLGLILSFSLIMIWGMRLPVVRIGRIAGQYAKPRSSGTEKVELDDGQGGKCVKEVPSFRGDNVNGLSPYDRKPCPQRLERAYFHSAATHCYLRSLLTSGFASLSHPRDWSLGHVRSQTLRDEFERISEGLSDALDFCRTVGANESAAGGFESGGGRGVLGEVDFFTSHEGLMLEYEEAMTRLLPLPPNLRPIANGPLSPTRERGMELKESELSLRYQTFCDPRLNFEQSLDVAFLVSNHFKRERSGRGRQGELEKGRDVLLRELSVQK
ncbi:hypothetical protein FRC08_008890 [Ceratobasidium sp. 394]|nr:hypothetical protein FRC08_008890 [Ceratobasidium sp. 394]